MLPLCLFVCLFILVPQCHVLLALFAYFPFWIVSVVDRQWANTKSNCTCCIRRGLGRRLRSSLLLNSSPSTSRDVSLSQLAEICQSPAISMHSDTCQVDKNITITMERVLCMLHFPLFLVMFTKHTWVSFVQLKDVCTSL